MADLTPCPFCNNAASIDRLGDRRQSTQYSCDGCGASLETGEEWGHGKAWNTRPREADLEARLAAVTADFKDAIKLSIRTGRRTAAATIRAETAEADLAAMTAERDAAVAREAGLQRIDDERHDAWCKANNRRVAVEEELLRFAAGKRGPIDKEEAQRLALKLGVPEWFNEMVAQRTTAAPGDGTT